MQTISRQSNIMIIDDMPVSLGCLVDILLAQGYEVSVFSGGEPVLKYAEQNAPDLILLGINSYDICAKLKIHPILKNVPVIFISSLDDKCDKTKVFECGAVDYIVRPFESKEVNACIKMHLALARVEILEKEALKIIDIEKQYWKSVV